MNTELDRLAATLGLAAPESRELALTFGLACAKRIEHLLEEPEALECLKVLENYVAGSASTESLIHASETASHLANRHRGSKSIDGCGHAAVSASYGVAKAVSGKAVEAAQYCAYAAVYAAGGYAAVAEREAFDSEFSCQLELLRSLVSARNNHPNRNPAPSGA